MKAFFAAIAKMLRALWRAMRDAGGTVLATLLGGRSAYEEPEEIDTEIPTIDEQAETRLVYEAAAVLDWAAEFLNAERRPMAVGSAITELTESWLAGLDVDDARLIASAGTEIRAHLKGTRCVPNLPPVERAEQVRVWKTDRDATHRESQMFSDELAPLPPPLPQPI